MHTSLTESVLRILNTTARYLGSHPLCFSKAYGTLIEVKMLEEMCPDFMYFCRRRHHPRHSRPKHEVKVSCLGLARSSPQHLHFNIESILYLWSSKMQKICVQFPGQKT